MSRAFVKEQDTEQADELGELPLSPHPNYVTSRGLELLRTRLAETQQRLGALRKDAFGAELERARIERELRWLSARIGSAQLISSAAQSQDRVGFGAAVELADADSGDTLRYRIVGEDEADPKAGSISFVSPVARSLLGKASGDVVGSGDQELEIVAIA